MSNFQAIQGNNATNANLTTGFIDLATYDELEKYMFGGQDATAYFVRETRKSTWFTQCPVTLSSSNGTPEFGSEFSVSISRAGDYLLGTWWNHGIIDAKAQISAVSGRIIEQNVDFIGKEEIIIDGKTYNTLHFQFTSTDKKLSK